MFVSIFNDVVGPVMRGPSSSHCAAALRIGRLARDLMDGVPETVLVEFDRHGALPTTYASQGSDMGLFGGLMGWESTDPRLPDVLRLIREAGVQVRIDIVDTHDPHPSTYRLTLENAQERHSLIALSTGGGMVKVIEIDGFPVSLGGDYQVTLIGCEDGEEIQHRIAEVFEADDILVHKSGDGQLLEIRSQCFVPDEIIHNLRMTNDIRFFKRLSRVLPVASRKDIRLPFTNCESMLQYDAGKNRPLWELALDYESERGRLSRADVLARMLDIVGIVRRSIDAGIHGTEYQDRILGYQCGTFRERLESGRLLDAGLLNRIVLYVTALMEVKSSMGVIVAAPTAGACAAFPAATLAAAESMGCSDEDAARAMLAGGVIGLFIGTASTFAAEVSGCQAEAGSASGMAAAALATLGGATLRQSIAASSMAIQNSLGMICDPVANRVEVPCLGKNVIAASNALACTNMALADYDPVIPLDEVIETLDRVGRSLPRQLCCTALGGLSITNTSMEIKCRLDRNGPGPHGAAK